MFENMYSFCQVKFLNKNNNTVSPVLISFAVTEVTCPRRQNEIPLRYTKTKKSL